MPTAQRLNIAMVAGETSGDLLSSHVIAELQQLGAPLTLGGIGGPAMAKHGFDTWWPSERLAVRGYVEVLRHLPGILNIRRQLRNRLLAAPPKLFVGIDAPDFNLRLEERLKAAGIPTVHFVSPSIWAWRAERMAQIKRAVDHMLCVFPFEPALYAAHNMRASYVGHPLADVISIEDKKAVVRSQLGFSAIDTIVALLPGSREAEIRYLLPVFLQTAKQLQRQVPKLQFLLPVAHAGLRAVVEQSAQSVGLDGLRVLQGQSHSALAACDTVLVASGTATLEAALFKRPMVIAYRMPALSWRMTQPKRLQPYVGLPNILCGEFVVPEFLQDACTADNLCAALLSQLQDDGLRQRLTLRFEQLHHDLRQGCAKRTAQILSEYL
jgi:lipid-A-disaccharide synthase